jgi:translation initiation factor IF-2
LKRELVYTPQAQHEGISLILVADTIGSLEAITGALPEDIKIISKKTGEITEADVLMAKSTGSFVIGFNTKVKPQVQKLAGVEKILVKNYTIIYEMLDELNDVLEGKKLSLLEQVLGTAKIQASFPFNKDVVLGIKVTEGRVSKGDKVRIERGDETVGEARVVSLRQGKDETSKVIQGSDAGIIISPSIDFKVGDMVVFHN